MFFEIGPKLKSCGHNEMSMDELDDYDSVGDGDCNGIVHSERIVVAID